MGKVEKRRMDWGKHKEVKLVHEVRMEVDSRDEARHTVKRRIWRALLTDRIAVKKSKVDENKWQQNRIVFVVRYDLFTLPILRYV